MNGLNLYCYCFNDPINYVDHNGHYPVKIQVGKYTIYFHRPHGNDPAAQRHVHIYYKNQKVGSRNFDGSIHDSVDYQPTNKVNEALLKHKWNWYGNKFTLFDFSDFYRETFPMQQSGYTLETIPMTSNKVSLETFPKVVNDYFIETIPQTKLDLPTINPFPLSNEEVQVLVIAGVVIIAVVAIALIPATGGASAGALAFI